MGSIEEYIYELSRAIGASYSVVMDGVGDKDVPGTALFGAYQLKDLVYQNAPYFGVLRTSTQGFDVEVEDIASGEVLVKSGKISYNGQIVSLEDQRVKIGRDFASPYTPYHVYGVYMGIPISEAKKVSRISSTGVSVDANASDAFVAVDDLQTPLDLGFPIQGYIGSEFVVFTGVQDSSSKTLKLASVLVSSHSAGSQINFVYKPRVKSLCGLPVEEQYQSNKSADDFEYYPPMPHDWLPVAKMLIVNPRSPAVVAQKYKTFCEVATTNVGDIPSPTYRTGVLTASDDVTEIDGVDISGYGAEDKILIKNLVDSNWNGIYYRTGVRTFARHLLAASSTDFAADFIVNISNGVQNKNKTFLFVKPSVFIFDTTAITFSLYSTIPVMTDQYSIKNLVIDWPYGDITDPVFETDDAKIIGDATNKLITNLLQSKDTAEIDNVIRSMETYTKSLVPTPGMTFKAYWGNRSFKPTSYFARGVSFGNLERFEFPTEFSAAYYNATGVDLYHTFAIFRGDLYKDNKVLTDQSFQYEVTQYIDKQCVSSLLKGSYIYGVTAVNTYGETSPIRVQVDGNTDNNFVNEIKSTDDVPTALSYHIYRRINLLGEQVEYRLTKEDEIRSLLVSDGSAIVTTPVVNTTIAIDGDYSEFGFTIWGRTTSVTATELLMGGVGLKMRFSNNSVITNPDAKIEFFVYDRSMNLLANGTPVYYSQINSIYNEFLIKLTPCCNIPKDDYVYFIMKISEEPQSAETAPNLQLLRYDVSEAEGASLFIKMNDSQSQTIDVNQTYYNLYGYIDDGMNIADTTARIGLRLTGETSMESSRLRVYVPPVDFGDLIIYEPTSQLTNETLTDITSTNTRNELKVTVIAQMGETGVAKQLSTITVPANTPRGAEFLLGEVDDLFDRVVDVWITPGSDLRISNKQINWSIYDLITVETEG